MCLLLINWLYCNCGWAKISITFKLIILLISIKNSLYWIPNFSFTTKNRLFMKLSTYAIILALLALFYGIALLFFPVQFSQNYGTTLDASTTALARLYGSAMGSFAILYWINRNIPESDKSWLGLLWSGVFFNVVNLIIAVKSMIDGVGNSMNWSTVILSVILTLCSLYFIFRRK